jgi:cell fate (sporulation/competence/biofilm development) regulator YmcA (YheA/YmcA/DUF963 family)
MANNDKRLYNYIVNTFGISKEKIMEYVEARVIDLFDNIDHDYIKNYCRQQIYKRLDQQVIQSISWDIERKVRKEVEEHMKKVILSGKIDVEFKPNVKVDINMERKNG